MTLFSRQKKAEFTPFSDFIRNASSKEKKRVYSVVMKNATEKQLKVIHKASAAG